MSLKEICRMQFHPLSNSLILGFKRPVVMINICQCKNPTCYVTQILHLQFLSPISKQWLNICQHNNIATISPPINVTVKRGIQIRETIKSLKTKTATHMTPQVHTLEILQQLKNLPLLAKRLALALMFWRQMHSHLVHCVLWRIFRSTPYE